MIPRITGVNFTCKALDTSAGPLSFKLRRLKQRSILAELAAIHNVYIHIYLYKSKESGGTGWEPLNRVGASRLPALFHGHCEIPGPPLNSEYT